MTLPGGDNLRGGDLCQRASCYVDPTLKYPFGVLLEGRDIANQVRPHQTKKSKSGRPCDKSGTGKKEIYRKTPHRKLSRKPSESKEIINLYLTSYLHRVLLSHLLFWIWNGDPISYVVIPYYSPDLLPRIRNAIISMWRFLFH